MSDLMRKRVDPLLTALVAFILFVLVFMVAGIPAWLARCTGWSYVYATRANLVVGVASMIGLVRYLARTSPDRQPASAQKQIIFFAMITLVLFVGFYIVNTRLEHFASLNIVCVAAVFFALIFVCLWSRHLAAGWALLLLPALYANGLVNPIARGLPALTQSHFKNWLLENNRADSQAKWLVLGRSARSYYLPEFIKAAGIRVLGGSRGTPDQEMARVLDPSGKYFHIYNRYARAAFVPSNKEEPVFEQTFVNSYDVQLPLKSDLFDQLGVRYILTIDLPESEATVPGFKLIGEYEHCRLLVRDAG
jgi:hypothetical protein